MQHIAVFSLILAACCALYAALAAMIALRVRSTAWMMSARNALQALAGLVTFSVLLLLYLLLVRDFRVAYVAEYTSLRLHPLYVISAFWAGQEGSLLFWAWALSLCTILFLYGHEKRSLRESYGFLHPPSRSLRRHLRLPFSGELSWIILILAIIAGFFLFQILMFSNPFRMLEHVPLDGRGMNPLLQTPYMAAHPPVLFIGYAGFAIPFALTFAALCSGTLSNGALAAMRRWTLFSWYFLGLGILLGAHWAYLELGWGGYWGWDPVENASFIPWITSTALLHTLILQQRKGLLTRWNLFLSTITFLLCVLGTFITRSGVLSSVHAYAESPAAMSFLLFIGILAGAFVLLSALRWKTYQSRELPGGLLSKPFTFTLSAQLFMGLGFAVLYGTLYPAITELFYGQQRVIGQAFFNRVSIPLGLTILALMGLCQVLPWKTTPLKELLKRLRVPCAIALGLVCVLGVLGLRQWLVLLSCGLGALILATFALRPRQLLQPFALFHLGTAILCVAIAVSSGYKSEFQAEISPGESFEAGAFRFQYLEKRVKDGPERSTVTAVLDVYRHEKKLTRLFPEKRFYSQPDSDEPTVTTEIGLYSSVKSDIYSILDGWDENDLTTFRFIISPMILWIWLGGFVMFSLGMLLYVAKS